jgi:hypothetical protein
VRALRRLGLALFLLLAFAPAAFAAGPEDTVAPGGKWFSGSWLQQSGTNCTIIGGAYPETMVSGIASYGGAASIPAVGQSYYTSFLLSVPGNPCGTGSSAISTDVILPPGTSIDTSKPIRCFGVPRNQTAWQELTNATWSFLGSSGRYCPTGASPSALHGGAYNIGFRPIANGQLFQIFVPVKSSQALIGAAGNPVHEFRWLTDSTGVYSNPGQSYVWANVLNQSSGSNGPFVYFANQAAAPFWKADASAGPPDTRNRVELWANLYTAGYPGTFCYAIHRLPELSLRGTCALDPGFNPNVPSGLGLAQVIPDPSATGPTGGYAPLYFDGPTSGDSEWDRDMRITWTFTPSGPGAPPAVSQSATFHTLAGPDSDGDGVADIHDSCPSTKGTESNGCQPALVPDPDGDGVFGAEDKCPSTNGNGSLNGCPGGVIPAATNTGGTTIQSGGKIPVGISGGLGVKKGGKLSRKALLKGLKVKVTCSQDSTASLALAITKGTAKKLKIKTKKTVTIASGRGACKAAGGGSVKLALSGKYKGKVRKAKKTFPALLGLKLSGGGANAAKAPLAVKVG